MKMSGNNYDNMNDEETGQFKNGHKCSAGKVYQAFRNESVIKT